MEIKIKYHVGKEFFDTEEEAKAFIANSADLRMINLFAEYKRDNGAQRVNTSIIEEFLAFAQSQENTEPVEKAETEYMGKSTSVDTASTEEDAPWDAPASPETAVEEEEVETPAPEETPAEEPVEEPVAAPSKSLFARP